MIIFFLFQEFVLEDLILPLQTIVGVYHETLTISISPDPTLWKKKINVLINFSFSLPLYKSESFNFSLVFTH
jgi:hypothetical protein